MNLDGLSHPLSIIIFLPLVAGLLILALPAETQGLDQGAGCLGVARSTWSWRCCCISATTRLSAGYQFVEKMPWVPQLGISYHVGVDGFSLPMVLLGALVVLCGSLVSWNVDDRPREFFSFLMFLGTSILGVFASLDLFQLFFFFEIAVFPKYLMIVLWGYPKTRNYGGMKLTIYLFVGSMMALFGVLVIYFKAGINSFDLLALEQSGFAPELQRWLFPFVFLGFAILGGIFPFHSWAPDGHVAAPTAVSMLLAGVEMKVGAFAALRAGIMLLPEGAQYWQTGDIDIGDGQRGLRRADRAGADRLQIRHRLLVRLAHGAGVDRHGHPDRARPGRGGHADVLARHHDGSLLCHRRHGLRPGAHARAVGAGRAGQEACPGRPSASSWPGWCRWACRASRASRPSSRSSWAPGRWRPGWPSSAFWA